MVAIGRVGARGARIIVASVLVTAALLVAGVLPPKPVGPPRVFVNWTESMPLGMYRVTGGAVKAGSLVIFPGRVIPSFGLHLPEYLLKRVVSSQGEEVRVDGRGLSLGGKLVAPRVKSFGVRFAGKLPSVEVLVLGENPRSFDSRYFGPVARRYLTRVKAIVTW